MIRKTAVLQRVFFDHSGFGFSLTEVKPGDLFEAEEQFCKIGQKQVKKGKVE